MELEWSVIYEGEETQTVPKILHVERLLAPIGAFLPLPW